MNTSDQIRYISAVECVSDEYVIAKDYSPFYVCDIMGQWQRYAAALQSEFNVPQCVKSVEGQQILNGTLTIVDNANTCDNLITEIKNTINKTEVCKKGCEIEVKSCQQRFKRATDVSIQFFVSTNTSRIAVKPNVVKALENHFQGSKAEVINSEIVCINNRDEFPVKVENEINAVCSTVPMGSYWNNKLEDCRKNTYKNFTGPCSSAEECCIECPEGEVTAMHGSLSIKDCYKNCSIGKFYNEDRKDCQMCPKGTYQGFPGMRYCDRCAKSTTTKQTGSISSEECAKCEPGKEIGIDGDCLECPVGTYRNETADSCIPCGKGLTTGRLGSSSESHCNVVSCVPGSQIRNHSMTIIEELIFAKTGCQYCLPGTYQNGFNQSTCHPCGDGLTTLVRNISAFSLCVPITDITCSSSTDCEKFGKDYECICTHPNNNNFCSYKCGLRIATPVNEESQLWWISLLIAFFVLLLVIVIVLIVWRKHMLNCCCSLIPSWLLNFFPEKLKTGMPGMRVSTLRRSRPSSMVSIPDDMMEINEEAKEPENISLPRLALQKPSAKSISNHSEQEEETCLDNHTLNDIRNGLRDFSNEPSPHLHNGHENISSIRQRLSSPKTAEVGLRVQTSHHSLQNQNNVEHVKKENGHSIKTSSYSKQGVQNSSYSINMSQNIKSNSDNKEVITGPPVLKWLQDKLMHDSQRLTDQSHTIQTDQQTNLDALSSPDWTSFNQFQSSRRSSSSNSDEHNNPANQFKSFESNNKSNMDEYFNKASAFSRSSITSAHRTGSFYTRNTRVQPYTSPNLNSVDDDPDAFFS
uniref:Tyrosine-protein kinase ephrin type A/B receptor-like domain-containing protein n=1 Tax=Panagrolaimus superbus TaxID=310955 RepID=A0A914Z296_9BILA